MQQTKFHPPDEAAMERLLKEYYYEPTGILLCLAWRAGLTRAEIGELTWDQVDFAAGLLRLPNREVPLEEAAAEQLEKWRKRCERFTPYVAATDRLRKRLVPQSISSLARNALDRAGMAEVRLQDLRYDYIRRQFRAHDWPYVLRIAGVSLSTYRAGLFRLVRDAPAVAPEPQDDLGDDFKLWRVLQAERGTPAGIALWLSSQVGLQCGEIAALTWDMVDLEANALRLPGRTVPLPQGVRRVLEEEQARRRSGDDPHVILTPRSRRPMEAARLTTVARAALIRGGIENRTMLSFRRDAAWEEQRERLRRYVAEHGGVTRMEAAELLDLSMGQAYARLAKLTEAGELTRLGARWYPAEAVVAPEQREEAVLAHIAEHGPVYRRDVEALLRVGRHKATELLNGMAAAGKLTLLPGTWQYAAAESNNSTIQRQADMNESTDSEPIIAVRSHLMPNT